jgi:transposase-like protein
VTDTLIRKKTSRYTPEQRAQVLAVLKANAGNVKKTSRETSVPPPSIRAWRNAPDQFAPAEVRAKEERDLASDLDELRWAYLDRAREKGAIRTTSGWYAVKAAAEITTMHQLLTGGPTERIEATPWGQVLSEIRDGRALRVLEGGKGEEQTA